MMVQELKKHYTNLVFKLFVDSCHNVDEWKDIRWDILLPIIRKNYLLVRTYEKFKREGISVSFPDYLVLLKRERERISKTLELIRRLTVVCEESGVPYLFPKAFQHYPDMGDDVDLFVFDSGKKIDKIIVHSLKPSLLQKNIFHNLSGKTNYKVEDYPSLLEIHHSRMGHLGEYAHYPIILINNRQKTTIGGITTFIPSLEDCLIIAVLQRVYIHFYLRISDMIYITNILQNNNLNWDYIIKITKEMGIFEGLCCLVSFLNDKYKVLAGKDIVNTSIKSILVKDNFKTLVFKNGLSYFSLSCIANVYSQKLIFDLKIKNWSSIGRLSLMPSFIAYVGLRNFARKISL